MGGVDASTGGKWIGTYGSTGYSLLNYTLEGHDDLISLPNWVVGVWTPTFQNTRDEPYPAGFPQGNFRSACKTPWSPDLRTNEVTLETDVPAGNHQCVWIWDELSEDSRVPEPPKGITRGTAAAVRGFRWGGSFHVDVELDMSKAPSTLDSVDISLYMVDYQRWWA